MQPYHNKMITAKKKEKKKGEMWQLNWGLIKQDVHWELLGIDQRFWSSNICWIKNI